MTLAARFLIPLILGFCILTCAWAEPVPVRIMIGSSEAALAPRPVFDGAGVLAPVQIVSLLGASRVDAENGDMIVTAAAGQAGTIKPVYVNGVRMIPVDKLIALIGGERSWDAAKRTLTLIAHLNSVEFDENTLKINCSFPVRVTTKTWDGNIIVDVANTKLVSEAKEVYVGSPLVSKARLGQYDSKTARVVMELVRNTGYSIDAQGAVSQVQIKVGDGLVPPPTVAAQPAKSDKTYAVRGIKVQHVDERSFNIVIATSNKSAASTVLKVSPPQIQINLPGARFDDTCEVEGKHALVNPELTKSTSGAQLLLRLSRPLAYSIDVRDTETIVYVRPPDKSGGTLSNKVVVVDPGHGGKECGAQAGGCSEKIINLQLAKQLSSALEKRGAHVILTRSGDDQLGLSARSKIAIDASADFFISLHCNSNVSPNSATGIETYYHQQLPSPKLLAYAIQSGVCKFTGMYDRQARSDRVLYQSGLGVLRGLAGSDIPGALVECGYLNHSSDRAKLKEESYRAKVAEGIVAGLRAYIEGIPIQ
ncbi:MAG: N-acetylmuramoyl-L-alanine amidase [Armatimonadetes bacterium]|nr:N-acetylmuramoyl-L-alanine amidase [Armatimonadota bacterium]